MSSKRLNLTNLPQHHLPDDVSDWHVPIGGARVILPPSLNQPVTIHLTSVGDCVQVVATQSLSGEAKAELAVTIAHEAANTQAEVVIKSVLTEKSSTKVSGMLQILPGVIGAASYFNHHSLIFDQARVIAIPALEISNNDVTCSHAATIRTITDDDTRYAQSRGIAKEDARSLLIDAFLATL
jgi:Fe-S cluster assembly scaffold protein SufB